MKPFALLLLAVLVPMLRPMDACHASAPFIEPLPHGQLHGVEEAIEEAIFDNCFLAGTLVAMADGSKLPIEQVRAGDRVKACDPLSGEVVDREVVRTFRNVTDTVVDVTWAPLDRVECMAVGQRGRGERHSVGSSREGGEGGEDGEPPSAQTVRCTPGHPWWVESQQRWRLAGDLRVGDLLMLDDGRPGVVLALSVREEVAQTFNFEVEREHTYYVSGHPDAPGVLVHNISRFRRMWTTYRNAGGKLSKKQYRQRFEAAQRSRPLPGEGAYRDVGGHHVHAHSAFRGHVTYNRHQGFSISQSYMHGRGWDHSAMSARQQQLFRQLGASGKANTLAEHSRIAQEALVAGGATATQARRLVRMSLRDLAEQGVTSPTRIPWFSP